MPYDVAYINLIGTINRDVEPVRKKNGSLDRDLAWQLIHARCDFVIMTMRDETIQEIRQCEIAHGGRPKGIWPDRFFALNEESNLTLSDGRDLGFRNRCASVPRANVDRH
jgi:hypothetical protein